MKSKNRYNEKMVIASIQMTSCASFEANIKKAQQLIKDASNNGAKLIVLPEYFAFMGLKEIDKFAHTESHLDGQMQSAMIACAIENNVWIIAGTHPIESGIKDKPFGRCYVYKPDGSVEGWYDKIHLFDVNVPDKTKTYLESKYSSPGEKAVCFDTPWGKIGLAVCYDLRFPELFRELVRQGAEIIVMPAAFTYATGKLHWEPLIKARAIENQCYFVASAQSGVHENGRETWGHSMVVSHDGEILQELKKGEGFVIEELDLCLLKQKRIDFPVLTHRKINIKER